MTRKAQWDARYEHTSVIDAAGNIYVLGGYNDKKFFNDVWLSGDKGETLHAEAPPSTISHDHRCACVRAQFSCVCVRVSERGISLYLCRYVCAYPHISRYAHMHVCVCEHAGVRYTLPARAVMHTDVSTLTCGRCVVDSHDTRRAVGRQIFAHVGHRRFRQHLRARRLQRQEVF
jgi:hypothetical protein